jgi:hypothetical protein
MWRIFSLALLLLAAACASDASSPASQPPASSGLTMASPQPDLRLNPSGGRGAASGLNAEPGCSEDVVGQPIAKLAWTPAADRGDEQVIEVTIFSFDLRQGAFSESLSPTDDQLTFETVSGQAIHQWRVLTRHGATWTPSEPAAFEGETCIIDG